MIEERLIIEKCTEYVKKVFREEYSGHDFYHTERVYKTACKLAKTEGADLFIVSLSALLHDVDDHKLSPKTYQNKDHAVCFLRSQGVDAEQIEKIITIIKEVSFMGRDSVCPTTLEGACVQDADRLDALGAIGIARTFAYGGSHKRVMYDPEEKPLLSMDGETYRKHESSSFNHFYEKILLLKDMMNTKSGKQMALRRHTFLEGFMEEFLYEWQGEDLLEVGK